MIDTPTKTLLSATHPTVAAQKSHHDTSRKQWDEVAKLRSRASELKTKVQAVTSQAEQETRQRKTLQTTYDALTKHRRELSVQLQLVTKSREIAEEKLAAMRKTLNDERAAMVHERVQWRPQLENLKRENEKLESNVKGLEARYTSSTSKVRQLEATIVQIKNSLAKTTADLQSSRDLQTKQVADRDLAGAAEKKLASLQEELDIIKRRHKKSLESMLQIQQNLKKQLQQAQLEKTTAEHEIVRTVEKLKQAEQARDEAIASRNMVVEECERQMDTVKVAAANEKVGPLDDTLLFSMIALTLFAVFYSDAGVDGELKRIQGDY